MAETEAPLHTVKTTRLELRILQESYLDDYHAISTNPKVAVWTYVFCLLVTSIDPNYLGIYQLMITKQKCFLGLVALQ
jgi:hypothetical protein